MKVQPLTERSHSRDRGDERNPPGGAATWSGLGAAATAETPALAEAIEVLARGALGDAADIAPAR